MLISLPPYEWFVNKSEKDILINCFTGSIGTDMEMGSVSGLTFSYKVMVDEMNDEPYVFRCLCGVRTPFGCDSTLPRRTEEECFDLTCEGLYSASEWLNERAIRFTLEKEKIMENIKNDRIQ